MPVQVNFIHGTFPGSIWSKLAERLGREPTNAEAKAEVKRILAEAAEARLDSR